jgi:hypothetical protein
MNAPTGMAEILLELLETGLLSIRALGWNGQADRCADEADHLHNLPGLLAEYSPERLLYYWDVERVCYMHQASLPPLSAWEPIWRRLESHVEATRRSLAHP